MFILIHRKGRQEQALFVLNLIVEIGLKLGGFDRYFYVF